MDSLLQVSAFDLGDRMRRGACSPVQVVQAHIARIEQVNPVLNALVAERFEQARAEAREAERRIQAASASDELPPLLGVPCTVKEFVAVQGMPWTAGMRAREGVVADHDGTVVRRLRDAGAIVLGVTNMAEGGLWMEARNPVYGTTNNPWNLRHSSGGSSGGCGALVASGAVPFSVCADIGGSIRIPAAFCGTFGHKPTGRMVPVTGHEPRPHGQADALLCLGPLTRCASDLLPLLHLLAGPDGEDPLTRAFDIPREDTVDPAKLEVFPVESHPGVAIWPAARRAIRRSARALEKLGAKVHPPDTLDVGHGLLPWSTALMAAGTAGYREVLGDGQRIPLTREVLRYAVGRSRHSGIPLVVCLLEVLLDGLPSDDEGVMVRLVQHRQALERRLGPRGVILHPVWSRPAPRHRAAIFGPLDWVCTALFNALEFPGTVAPVGFSSEGLPTAVQILGPRGADARTIGVARLLEGALGGWTMASPG